MKSFCHGMGCIYETDWVYNLHTLLKEECVCLQDK